MAEFSLDVLLEAERRGIKLPSNSAKALEKARAQGDLEPRIQEPEILPNPVNPIAPADPEVLPPKAQLSEFFDPTSRLSADLETGGDALDRVAISFKGPNELGAIKDYLESRPDIEEVQFNDNGDPFYRPKGGKRFIKLDEDSVTFRDLADIVGPAIESGPAIAAGLSTGANPLAVAGAQALGSTAKQAISSQIGESDEVSLEDRATTVAFQTALAGGVQKATNLATNALSKIAPGNLVAQHVNKQMQTAKAMEGKRLAEATGLDLTPGAVTGNPATLTFENAARQSVITRDRVFMHDMKTANVAIDKIHSIADKFTKSETNPEAIGEKLRSAVKTGVDKVFKLRDSVANAEYGEVRALAKKAKNEKFFEFDNFREELEFTIETWQNVLSKDATNITKQAKELLNRIDSQGPATITEAMQNRSFFSNASKGTGNVFKDIESNLNRNLARRYAAAVGDDFSAMEATVQGPIGEALKKANKTYANYSDSIDFLKKSVVGKMVGEDVLDTMMTRQSFNVISGEDITAKLIKMHPSQHKVMKGIIEEFNPEVTNDVKRYFVERALEIATDLPPAGGIAQVPLSSNKFVNSLPKQRVMDVWFSKTEQKGIKDVSDALIRWGDRTGANTSGTAPMTQLFTMVRALGGFSVRALARVSGEVLGMKKIASAMTTSEGRKALMTVTSANPTRQALFGAVGYLSLTWAMEDAATKPTGKSN